ncbi:hypothetical protein FHS15_005595 [Paenibacillus castaneae]|uniref:hypothetical protein n=1 Tax=Paenibacillus castaneae TaxID=474957 RepID=UPI000C9C9A26|nr:hypothetical protein [Paenibacillus castaneae]NIK80409.1 hypothetical protein [Paenibacillus castaneae]
MSFQFGSNSPDIQNPFKREGMLYLISGILISLIGIISIMIMRKQLADDQIMAGWFQLLQSLLLLGVGTTFMTKGLLKLFRFYIGRGIPTSLSKNLARSEKHVYEPQAAYHDQHLDQMLAGRKNITFLEPNTLLDRLIFSIFPNMLFLPYSMRNYLHIIIHNAGYSFLALGAFLLSILSGMLGLTSFTTSPIGVWLGAALLLFVVVLWVFNAPTLKRVNKNRLIISKKTDIFGVVFLSLVVPTIGEWLVRKDVDIPVIDIQLALPLIFTFVFIAIITIVTILISKTRSEMYEPLTEVSEFREHWQENVHPQDFFRSLDMELATLRYKEFPNRVYRELTPTLQMEGSMDKGSFSGDTIQETQPIYEEIVYPRLLQQLRLWISVGGHALILCGALLLFLLNQDTDNGFVIKNVFNELFYPIVLWLCGSSALILAHMYWAEMHFTSYLIQFQGEGTYTESKLSVGMAITDSTRSENTIVRSSFSPWLLVTRLVTSTLAGSGSGNLSGPRYIISMHKADDLLSHLVQKTRSFVQNRQIIATATSSKDFEAFQQINALNEAAPAKDTLLASGSKPSHSEALEAASKPNKDNPFES